jgi:hypothetical protein
LSILEEIDRPEVKTKLNPVRFLFDSRDSQESRQTFDAAIRSILWQLCHCLGLDSFPKEVLSLYESHGKGQSPSSAEVLRMLDTVLAALPGATIILDALDECSDKDVLLDWLRQMAGNAQQKRIRIFTTSRDDIDIRQCLDKFGIQIEERTRSEMERYINNYIEGHATMKSWDNHIKKQVCMELLTKGEGM